MVGVQTPSFTSIPKGEDGPAEEAIKFAKECGLKLDPWQQHVLRGALRKKKNGRWAAFEVGLIVPRQNGKGAVLEALELASIFLFGDGLIVHSAHEFSTAHSAFERMEILLEEAGLTKELKARSGISRSHGDEGFKFKSRQRIRYRTRTKGGGRGFSGDKVIFDEAMQLPEFTVAALLPILSSRPNPQVWYTGSAVDQTTMHDGVVLARVRERGHKGGDKSLAFFEWTAGDKDASCDTVDQDFLIDMKNVAKANPGLGIRITEEYIENEFRAMDDRSFAVERDGIGSWPATDRSLQTIIDMETWEKLKDNASLLEGRPALAFDVSPSRAQASIALAGPRADDFFHLEVIEPGMEIPFTSRGTGWLVDRIVSFVERNNPAVVICAGSSPAGSLVGQLEDRGVKVEAIGPSEEAKACGNIFDFVEQERVRYREYTRLDKALKGAKARPLSDSWAWARKTSSVDITPLVAVTLALWGAIRDKPTVYEGRGVAVVGPEEKKSGVRYVDGEAVAA